MSHSAPTTLPDPLVEFFIEIAKDLGKSLWDNTIGRGKKESDWKMAARRYREAITRQYGHVQVFGQARPTDLLDIFTDVNVLEKPVALRRYDIQALQEWFAGRERRASFHEREERMPGLDALDRTQKLFILGKPGAGKTTFMKYLAVMAAGGSARLPYIPIFISLKALADSGDDLLTFIAHQFDICQFENAEPFIQRMLKKGKALALFDGLDEVSAGDGRRDEVIDALRDFSQKYDENKIVITCRVAAADYMFEGFEYVEMADFTPQQVETFITHWFVDEPDLAQKMLAELARSENEGILELTQNPLLLTLLCIAYEETLSFPARRVEVYEDAVDALLRKWDTSRRIKRDEIYRKLSLGRKRQMLARIAYETFRQGEYFISQRKLEKMIVTYLARVPEAPDEVDIDGEAVLKAIAAQHGLLVERSRRIYSFSHLTFQEYFTARYIVDNEARGAVDDLMQHAFDDRWREVFLLVASMLDDAEVFIGKLRKLLDTYATENDLTPLLVWIEEKRIELEKNIRINAIRGDIEPIIYHPVASRAWWIYHGHIGTFSFGSAKYLALILAHAFDLDLNLDILLAFILDVNPDLILFLDQDSEIDIDSALHRALDLGGDLSQVALVKALQSLQPPSLDAPDDQLELFRINFEAIVDQFRPSSLILARVERQFQEKQMDKPAWLALQNYLKEVRLLLQCLDVAYVTNRRAIETRLLLPPPSQSQ